MDCVLVGLSGYKSTMDWGLEPSRFISHGSRGWEVPRSKCQLVRFLPRALLGSRVATSFPALTCGREDARASPYKGTNAIMGTSRSPALLNLIASRRSHLQIPSVESARQHSAPEVFPQARTPGPGRLYVFQGQKKNLTGTMVKSRFV